MKKQTLITAITINFLLITINLFSQPCLPEGITFTTQAEIDSFQINYPYCTEIEGDVTINGDDICNLSGLNILTTIGGSLLIGDDDYPSNWNPLLFNLLGLNNLNSIGGDLNILRNDILNNLTGLENLVAIGGDLNISRNDSLTSLTGLEDLVAIGGDLKIYLNPALTSLIELYNLTTLNGSLHIAQNESLTSLTGLENLTIIHEDLFIAGMLQLETLAGLNNLYEIEGNLGIGYEGGPVSLTNPSLISLTGLDNLHIVGGDIQIRGNSLSSLSGLDNLQTIGGDLFIVCNPLLKNLTGLENLSSIEGIFQVGWELNTQGWSFMYNNLKSFNGLGNLSTIGGGLSVLSCDSLENFEGLEALNSIGGSLYIDYNDLLSSFQGLENLTSINGYIRIGGVFSNSGNPSLTSLAGLNNIDPASISNLSIISNSSLTDCDVQSICDYLISPNGTVTIFDNANGCNNPPEVADACGNTVPCLPYGDYYFNNQADIDSFQSNYPGCIQLEGNVIISGNNITNLYGLNDITSIGGNLLIRYNSSLSDLMGLENLYSIVGNLRIYNCDSLISLTGLENLTSIYGDIIIGYDYSIWGNPSLVSLSGIDNIDAGTIDNIEIRHNSSLSQCHVQSICDYLAAPNGEVTISNNAPGCNNQQEVLDSCIITSVSEIILEETFTISPNPVGSTTLIKYNLNYKSPVTIKIFDLTGQEIATLVNEIQQEGEQQVIFNTFDLPAGIYFCVLKTNNGIQTKKIIKL